MEAVAKAAALVTAVVSGSEWSISGGADGGGGISRRDGGELACSESVLWLHRLRQVAVEAAVEALVTAAVGGCGWSTGGGADGGSGFRRHDGGELACWQSVLCLHRLRQVAVEEALAEAVAAVVTAAVSGCEWSSSGVAK